MLTLAIHTADPACDIAIVRGGALLAHIHEPMQRGQDARLPGLVQQACVVAGISLTDIDRFGVVTGPGSFTGVRVGVAFVRGLALATKTAAIGITSLEAALPAGQQGSAIVVLSAKKRAPDITYWTQRFRSGLATGQAEEMPLAALIDLLQAHPHMVYGSAPALVAEMPEIDVHPAQPCAIRVAELTAEFNPAEHPPRPVYAREPDALLPCGTPV